MTYLLWSHPNWSCDLVMLIRTNPNKYLDKHQDSALLESVLIALNDEQYNQLHKVPPPK